MSGRSRTPATHLNRENFQRHCRGFHHYNTAYCIVLEWRHWIPPTALPPESEALYLAQSYHCVSSFVWPIKQSKKRQENVLWSKVYFRYLSFTRKMCLHMTFKHFYRTFSIRGHGCKQWCHRPKLTLSVISDVKPSFTFTFFALRFYAEPSHGLCCTAAPASVLQTPFLQTCSDRRPGIACPQNWPPFVRVLQICGL